MSFESNFSSEPAKKNHHLEERHHHLDEHNYRLEEHNHRLEEHRHGPESNALINRISLADWKAHSAMRANERLRADEQILIDSRTRKDAKREAAHDLYDHGVRQFHFHTGDKLDHTYQLDVRANDPRKVLRGLIDGHQVLSTSSAVEPYATNREQIREYGSGRGNFRHPSGVTFHNSPFHHYATYQTPAGEKAFRPSGAYDHHQWSGIKNADNSVEISFNGCAVDTDGRGAYRHPEDRTRQSGTSLRLSNGQSLDTDKENFFVLPPSVAKAYGIRKGDLGWLVQNSTGKAVPVVFGDSGPEHKMGEASVHALKSLGYNVNGRSGVEKSEGFRVVFVPHSGDGTGDIAGNPEEMARRLTAMSNPHTTVAT